MSDVVFPKRTYPLYRYRHLKPNQYEIVATDEGGKICVQIYFLNELLRTKFRTPMVFSYDGKKWVKTAGGRAVKFEELVRELNLEEEVVKQIKALVGGL